jgi:HEAT repeats
MKPWLCALLLLIPAFVHAKSTSYTASYGSNGVSLIAGFIPDTNRIILGEPLFLTFVLTNHGTQYFNFSHIRQEIFTFTATNAAGQPVKLHNRSLDFNGMSTETRIPPDKTYTDRLFLNHWCIFDQPGDYTVTGTCNFYAFANRTHPVVPPIVTTFKLTILPPDPKRLAQIIDYWGQAVQTNGALHDAALALADINDPRTIPYLALLTTKTSDIPYLTVTALTRFTNNPAAADALIDALKTSEDYVAQLAGTALRNTHQQDHAARVLLPALTNSDPNLRLQTIRAVSYTGSELAFTPLVARLHDDTNSVRYAAAEAIGRLGNPQSFATLTNCLSDSDFALRIAAVKGLIALNLPVQAAWLTPIIKAGGENIPTYYQAIDLLRLHGGDQAAPGLASCLDFDDPSVAHANNFRLLLALEYSPNGPKYYYKWHHDPNRPGTEPELTENRQILSELKSWFNKRKQN